MALYFITIWLSFSWARCITSINTHFYTRHGRGCVLEDGAIGGEGVEETHSTEVLIEKYTYAAD